jgi:O-antigen ligase/polysaccharide polymerase Wzy-like membrane protein
VTGSALPRPRVIEALSVASGTLRPEAVRLLQVFAVAVMLFPSTTVIAAIGAAGYPASLVGVVVFVVFLATVLFGFHDPSRFRHPLQGVLAVFWMSVLASYVVMDQGLLDGKQLLNADRVLIKMAVITGAVLVAAEWLRSLDDVRRVLRVLCWGGAICGFIAAAQYWFSYDLAQYLRAIPGFTETHDNPIILTRGALNRATGTAITPIELGVVAGMLLPLAIYLGMTDRHRSGLKRWAPAALIAMGDATSVSRSGILSVIVALGVFVALMPPVPRVAALSAVPFAVTAAFATAHGLIGTLATFFSAGSSDTSIQYRTHDYPVAQALWQAAPWFGHGPGTYLPSDPLDIFDNQYLDAAVELGVVGIVALIVFLLVPALVALNARRRSTNPDLRLLCAALAGAGFAAPVSSVTFDSLAFPMFVNVYALVIGMIGACWRLAKAEQEAQGVVPSGSTPLLR